VSAIIELAQRLRRQLLTVVERYRFTSAEKTFLRTYRVAKARDADASPTVLVEAVEEQFYLALFGCVIAGIAANRPVRVLQFTTRSLRPGGTRSLYHAFKSMWFYNTLTDRKWIRLYSAFCDGVAFRSAQLSRGAWADLIQARRIWKSLESREALLELTVSGIKVGDLVYDTYLRFKPAATVDLKSRYLWLVLWQTLRDLRAASEWMSRAKPFMLISTYSTYIQHGVPVRAALTAGIKVFTFGNYQEFYKQLSMTDWTHTRNPDGYRSGFAALEAPERSLAQADRALTSRLAGAIDTATAYMQRSAYQDRADLPDGIAGSLVLFLHDFFDSPHCYRWMIFADFWDWATFTLDLTRTAGIRAFVKPHPNEVSGSKSVVRQLKSQYPDVTWLSKNTSNVQLAEAGMGVAVTIYGTVAHELAYLGIPSIAAGHNPHISYSFCHTARNRDEYAKLILGYRDLPRSPAALRQESLEFYCMHNLAITSEQLALRDVTTRFRTLEIASRGNIRNAADFITFKRDLDGQPAFRQACKQMTRELGSSSSAGGSHGQDAFADAAQRILAAGEQMADEACAREQYPRR